MSRPRRNEHQADLHRPAGEPPALQGNGSNAVFGSGGGPAAPRAECKIAPLGHQAISASAGSGKTFQLAHRVIRLLADGHAADRICALTFSRKAAGEIFESVVKYLAEASEHAAGAAAVSRRLGIKSPGAAGYLGLLRQFVDHLHRLHIGTLDSFMVGVLRAFPAELGLAPDFNVMDADGAPAGDLRRDVLQRLLGPGGLPADERARFLEAFKQATFGREEKDANSILDRFVTDYRNTYRLVAEADAWGTRARLWPAGSDWLDARPDLEAAAATCEAAIAASGWSDDAQSRWREFVADAAGFGPYSPWSAAITYMFERLYAGLTAPAGQATVKIGRKELAIPEPMAQAARQLLGHLMASEIRTALNVTQGLHRVLALFESRYDDWSRRAGSMTFTDAQYLLTAANTHSGGALLSRTPNQPGRLYIDFRLDARLDHWLLDEFQDTSDLQWAAIRNLVDEILQDDSGRRTFFYVGDVKQAIYGWRGGNPRLFTTILDTYQPRIAARTLDTSFRSCAPVLDFVNAVFGDLARTPLADPVRTRWNDIWRTHQPAPGTAARPGYAALLQARPAGEARPDATDRHRLVAALVRQLNPLRRRLQVAVLVRSNSQGRAVVDALRRACPGLPVVHEGNAPLNDSPVTTLLVSLLCHAAHPGDTLARRHVLMSPLADDLADLRADRDTAEPLLRQIHTHGFQAFLRDWGGKLHARTGLDTFGLRRLQDLLGAAGEFDATGSRDPDAFRRFLDHYAIAESAAGLAVRVMTVHQSKGLGFDVVILPELQDTRANLLKTLDLDLVVARRPRTDVPEWVLKLPRRVVAERQPALAACVQAEDTQHALDELCVLYVALTRAKQALYVVTTARGDDAETYPPSELVTQQLTREASGAATIEIQGEAADLLAAFGASDWYGELPSEPPASRATATAAGAPREAAARTMAEAEAARPSARAAPARRAPVEPSAHEGASHSAAWLFHRESREALDFGTAMHARFEQIEWLEMAGGDAAISIADAAPAVAAQFQACLGNADVRALLARPAGGATLWRELRFELLLGGTEWVRGAFDRVVIEHDLDGRPRRATIIDFKSDQVTDPASVRRAAETYRSQLELYARALSQILDLPIDHIGLTLLFTRLPCVHRLR